MFVLVGTGRQNVRHTLADLGAECVLVEWPTPYDLLRNGANNRDDVTHHCASHTRPSGLLNAVSRPIRGPSNASRATSSRPLSWVANDRLSRLKGPCPTPPGRPHTLQEQFFVQVENILDELPELLQTTSLTEREGASLDHPKPESSLYAQRQTSAFQFLSTHRQLSLTAPT